MAFLFSSAASESISFPAIHHTNMVRSALILPSAEIEIREQMITAVCTSGLAFNVIETGFSRTV